jgi:hypothetical protein
MNFSFKKVPTNISNIAGVCFWLVSWGWENDFVPAGDYFVVDDI